MKPTPARIIKNLTKELKTFCILEGVIGRQNSSKAQVETLGSLPSKDQLRAQFMSVLNGPISAFARVLNARAEKMGAVRLLPPLLRGRSCRRIIILHLKLLILNVILCPMK